MIAAVSFDANGGSAHTELKKKGYTYSMPIDYP
jgi:hypothetical protein